MYSFIFLQKEVLKRWKRVGNSIAPRIKKLNLKAVESESDGISDNESSDSQLSELTDEDFYQHDPALDSDLS
jgi:hypothetical protein